MFFCQHQSLFFFGYQTIAILASTYVIEYHYSHWKISRWQNIFPLLFNCHFWIWFTPIHHCSSDTCGWKTITSKSMFETAPLTCKISFTYVDMNLLLSSEDEFLPDPDYRRYLILPSRRDTLYLTSLMYRLVLLVQST